MSMNLIVEGKRYNPNRDIAHNFHFLCETAAHFAAAPLSPSLAAYAASEGVTQAQIGKAVECLYQYINLCLDTEHDTPESILRSIGFFALPPAAQTIVLSKLGIVLACSFFHGIRDATMIGEPPIANPRELEVKARRAVWQCERPAWMRRLSQLWAGLRSQ